VTAAYLHVRFLCASAENAAHTLTEDWCSWAGQPAVTECEVASRIVAEVFSRVRQNTVAALQQMTHGHRFLRRSTDRAARGPVAARLTNLELLKAPGCE